MVLVEQVNSIISKLPSALFCPGLGLNIDCDAPPVEQRNIYVSAASRSVAWYHRPIAQLVRRNVWPYLVKKKLEKCSSLAVWSARVQQVGDNPVKRNLVPAD